MRFHDANTIEEVALRAVNLGGDADTTRAICVHLAGTYWGISRISEPIRSGPVRMDMIEDALKGIIGQ